MSPRTIVVGCMVGVYLLEMGFLGGTIVSAIRFDQRRAVILKELDHASSRVRARLMVFERDAARSAAVR